MSEGLEDVSEGFGNRVGTVHFSLSVLEGVANVSEGLEAESEGFGNASEYISRLSELSANALLQAHSLGYTFDVSCSGCGGISVNVSLMMPPSRLIMLRVLIDLSSVVGGAMSCTLISTEFLREAVNT